LASERATRKRHVVLAFALGAMGVAYLDRVAISTAAPAMKADLALSDIQMGFVFSAFTLAYALFEVPSGWLADRFGARWMLTCIVLWWSARTAATGTAVGFVSLLLVRWLFRMGEAGVLPSRSPTSWRSATACAARSAHPACSAPPRRARDRPRVWRRRACTASRSGRQEMLDSWTHS
jgi:MFS family permease